MSVPSTAEPQKIPHSQITRGPALGRSVSSPYLFSGLLKCSVCGANISIVSDKWRGRGDAVYGYPQNSLSKARWPLLEACNPH